MVTTTVIDNDGDSLEITNQGAAYVINPPYDIYGFSSSSDTFNVKSAGYGNQIIFTIPAGKSRAFFYVDVIANNSTGKYTRSATLNQYYLWSSPGGYDYHIDGRNGPGGQSTVWYNVVDTALYNSTNQAEVVEYGLKLGFAPVTPGVTLYLTRTPAAATGLVMKVIWY